jgi:hypothetical protein
MLNLNDELVVRLKDRSPGPRNIWLAACRKQGLYSGDGDQFSMILVMNPFLIMDKNLAKPNESWEQINKKAIDEFVEFATNCWRRAIKSKQKLGSPHFRLANRVIYVNKGSDSYIASKSALMLGLASHAFLSNSSKQRGDSVFMWDNFVVSYKSGGFAKGKSFGKGKGFRKGQ